VPQISAVELSADDTQGTAAAPASKTAAHTAAARSSAQVPSVENDNPRPCAYAYHSCYTYQKISAACQVHPEQVPPDAESPAARTDAAGTAGCHAHSETVLSDVELSAVGVPLLLMASCPALSLLPVSQSWW